jgi:hypothetical protein
MRSPASKSRVPAASTMPPATCIVSGRGSRVVTVHVRVSSVRTPSGIGPSKTRPRGRGQWLPVRAMRPSPAQTAWRDQTSTLPFAAPARSDPANAPPAVPPFAPTRSEPPNASLAPLASIA